jgi:hypothetical protein
MTAKKKPEPEKVVVLQPEQEEPYRPMAVPEPTPLERLEALTIEMKVMKDWINRHSRSHTGRDAI